MVGSSRCLSKLLDFELQLIDVVAQVIQDIPASSHRDYAVNPLDEFGSNFATVLEVLIAKVIPCLLDHILDLLKNFSGQVFSIKFMELNHTLVCLGVT